jgi:hypothetical protein
LLIKCCNAADDSYKTAEGGFEKGYDSSPEVVATAEDPPLDRALVGLMDIEGEVHAAVSIRGTKENENWVQNADTELVEAKLMEIDQGSAVRVHRGYNGSLQRLFQHGLGKKLERARERAGKDTSFLVIGHSKGGGMAVQLAHALLQGGWKVLLVTFGAPPTGNAALSNYLEDRLGSEGDDGQLVASYRVVNSLDVVPHSLSWNDAYQHFGDPIVLDYPLLETLDTVLNIAGNIAGVCKGKAEPLKAAVDSGTGLVQHHLLGRYLENLDRQGDWDYQRGFEYAKRGAKSISTFLAKTGLKDELADKLGPAVSDLFETKNTGRAHELVKQLDLHTIKDRVPSGGAGFSVANVIPIIGLVVQALNLGVSCVTLYKVHSLQAAVADGFGKVMDMQTEMAKQLKDHMGQGFKEILEKINEQNLESLLTLADQICAATSRYGSGDASISHDRSETHYELAIAACKKFLRALSRHLPEDDCDAAENKTLVVWLLQMAIHSACLGLASAQRLGFDGPTMQKRLWEYYDELAPRLGRLILHQQIEEPDTLLLSEQLNALCRLVVGDGVVRCPRQCANSERVPQPSLMISTAPSPQHGQQQPPPPPHPPLSAQLRLRPPPPQELTNDSPAQCRYLDARKRFDQCEELTTGQVGKPKEEGACGAGVVQPLALGVLSDKTVRHPAGSAVCRAEEWQEWVVAQQESLLQTLSNATLNEAKKSVFRAISHGHSTMTESLWRGAEVVAARCCVDSEDEGGGTNLAFAFALRHMLAQEGHENAQCNLGVMYAIGQGVQTDEKKAMAWFQKAAEQGNEYAQTKLRMVRGCERVRRREGMKG